MSGVSWTVNGLRVRSCQEPSNKAKHGIDFEEAQRIWQDRNRFELLLESELEPRHLMVGMIDAKHWTAIIAYRDMCVRIISVRRAGDVEIACYEG